MEYACDEKLTASERLLWYALMHIMNQRAEGKIWPGDFIRISNDRLLSLCPMKFDTMAAARNSLKQRGLIEVEKGEKNKKSPAYRMIYFFPQPAPPNTDDCYPEISDNMGYNTGGNTGGNTGYNMGYNRGGNMGDLYYINYTRDIPEQDQRDSEEQDQQQKEAYARARAEADHAWKDSFGSKPTPALLHEVAWRAANFGFDAGVLARIIHLAAAKNLPNAFEYIIAVICDWGKNGVKTVEDADEYAVVFDALNNRGPFKRSFADGAAMLDEFRDARGLKQA